MGHGALRFGLVTGEAYISNSNVVVYDVERDRKVEMDYILRRSVAWGPTISRGAMPYGLLASLKANQTVFSLDKHWQAIYHSLYPAFSWEEDLFLSLKIKAEQDIDNYSIVQVLSFLNEIELISKELDGQLNVENFDALFITYVRGGRFTLTTKAQFNSPGDIWNRINFSGLSKSKMAYAVIAYSMLFGNEHAGMDGVIDLESRQKLWQIVVDRINEKEMGEAVSNLELSSPKYDTSVLESMDKKATSSSLVRR